MQAYIAAMPGWKRDVGRRLDALIVRTVPDVRKAVKWNSPFSTKKKTFRLFRAQGNAETGCGPACARSAARVFDSRDRGTSRAGNNRR